MQNSEIRMKAKEKNVKLWEIADRIGLTDGNFSRKLRKELSDEEREKVLLVIEQIAAEREAARNEQTEKD